MEGDQFQGFTARRTGQGLQEQPTTPIRRAVPSYALGTSNPPPILPRTPIAAPTAKSASFERNNVREPDPFDGTDPTKLRSFFAQLEL
ncbi:hypothetical protein L226DRAFT_574121, partial [Lentinus tigrinus ALCF2SS1-7]|uniref:uncharacterized protein n=1 Tax=Lentinus tigrinus ALCF2SS1-7 TaxID=1328758 RepID=UPI001165D504